MAVARFS